MEEKKNKLEETRQKIQRSGKILYKVCSLGKIALIVLIVAQIALIIAVAYSPEAAQFIGPRLDNNFLFNTLKRIAGLDEMEPKHQALIGCGVILFSYVAILVILDMAIMILKHLASEDKPFDINMARRIRYSSLLLLLFIVYNPLLGIVSTAVMILFSYIMEYGANIQERADETNRIQEEMIFSFAEITENKSGQTGQHIKRVSEYSRIIASQLGLPLEEVERIRIASTMHDVGKLLIPSEILEKPGKLTKEEYETIKTHTTLGGQLLENVEGEEMKLSRTIALQHHEKPDGTGYPKNLEKDEISLEGKIVAVADVYDALTSKRSYKDAWKEEDAYQEILKGRGTQFDEKVVDAFVAAHDKILEVQSKFKD